MLSQFFCNLINLALYIFCITVLNIIQAILQLLLFLQCCLLYFFHILQQLRIFLFQILFIAFSVIFCLFRTLLQLFRLVQEGGESNMDTYIILPIGIISYVFFIFNILLSHKQIVFFSYECYTLPIYYLLLM